MNIGHKLRQIRKDRHLSVKEVSKNTGIPQSCIYDYETSRIEPPLKRYILLMEYYGIDADMFLLKNKEFIDITDYSIQGKTKAWLLNRKERIHLFDSEKNTSK